LKKSDEYNSSEIIKPSHSGMQWLFSIYRQPEKNLECVAELRNKRIGQIARFNFSLSSPSIEM